MSQIIFLSLKNSLAFVEDLRHIFQERNLRHLVTWSFRFTFFFLFFLFFFSLFQIETIIFFIHYSGVFFPFSISTHPICIQEKLLFFASHLSKFFSNKNLFSFLYLGIAFVRDSKQMQIAKKM